MVGCDKHKAPLRHFVDPLFRKIRARVAGELLGELRDESGKESAMSTHSTGATMQGAATHLVCKADIVSLQVDNAVVLGVR